MMDAAGLRHTGGRRRVGLLWMAGTALILTGCASRERPLSDAEQITRSVLVLLASQGRAICVDDQTRGNSLAVYREMMVAPRASRRQLRWYPATPLWPGTRVATGTLTDAELRSAPLRIAEPEPRTDALDEMRQMGLDTGARVLATQTGGDGEEVSVNRSWAPAGIDVRWWPLNIVGKGCWPSFELGNPVRGRTIAFVTVRAEHWATLYALRRSGGRWAPYAEWSRWLY